jgi:SAM-dependent methyltransferase
VTSSNENAITLESYNNHIAEFIAGTPDDMIGDTKIWIDSLLALLPRSAQIRELGSGFGRDAAYMHRNGYTVECTDGAQGFVDLLNAQGQTARLLNVVTDSLGSQCDLIFANAVFEHLPRPVFERVLTKVHHALRPSAFLGFSVREGTGERWSDHKLGAPRYFCYWDAEMVRTYLAAAQFEVLSVQSSRGFQGVQRLYVIAQRLPI